MEKLRLDVLLVERGLCESREKAKRAIMAGQVLVAGQVTDKPSTEVATDAAIELKAEEKFVSRGGHKLEAALDHFKIRVTDALCADLGASTGGFTDCLLQRGAARVHAVDVGKGQIAYKLRRDPRVTVHDGVNARHLRRDQLGEVVDIVTMDLAFIGLAKVLPAAKELLKTAGGGNVAQASSLRSHHHHASCKLAPPWSHPFWLWMAQSAVRDTRNDSRIRFEADRAPPPVAD